MLIAHISDCHIAAPGREAYGVVATDRHLLACVERINGLKPKPDLAVVTGDITYGGALNEAEYARSILERLDMPCFLVPGNHDQPDTLWQIFGGRAIPDRQGDALSYCLDQFPVRLIGLDSTLPGEPGGAWSEEQNRWLRGELNREPARPTILFLHHPPLRFGVPETDEDGFIGTSRLGELVAAQKNILAIACGHIHLQAHAFWQGTVVSTAPSTGLHLLLDLTMREPSRFVPDVAGFQLHYINGNGCLVSHGIMLGDNMNRQPALFEE